MRNESSISVLIKHSDIASEASSGLRCRCGRSIYQGELLLGRYEYGRRPNFVITLILYGWDAFTKNILFINAIPWWRLISWCPWRHVCRRILWYRCTPISVQGDYTLGRGWRIKGDFMGGPFVSHTFGQGQSAYYRIWNIYLFTIKMKRNLVRQMSFALYLEMPAASRKVQIPVGVTKRY